MKLLNTCLLGFLIMVFLDLPERPEKENKPAEDHKGTKKDEAWQEPLILREEQGGIAGLQVQAWEIQPSGTWKVSQFSLDNTGQEVLDTRKEKTGKLTDTQLKKIAKEVKGLPDLPAKLGKDGKINPHRYLLTLGSHHSTLEGVGPRRSGSVKDNILKSTPKDEQQKGWVEFAAIADLVCEVCK